MPKSIDVPMDTTDRRQHKKNCEDCGEPTSVSCKKKGDQLTYTWVCTRCSHNMTRSEGDNKEENVENINEKVVTSKDDNKMNIYEKLLNIQVKLNAPKSQYNNFGKYNYRSLEDILMALKPLLLETKSTLIITDSVIEIKDRIYIQAKAQLIDTENPTEFITNTAPAREPQTKKGMDEAQITGATSSYARKYCLNGLFCIDDNKDPDTQPPPIQGSGESLTVQDLDWLSQFCDKKGYVDRSDFMRHYGISMKTDTQIFQQIKQQILTDDAAS